MTLDYIDLISSGDKFFSACHDTGMVDEEAHLAMADRHIAEAEQRIAGQERLIDFLNASGLDHPEARRLLFNLNETLKQFYIHRRLILAELRRAH